MIANLEADGESCGARLDSHSFRNLHTDSLISAKSRHRYTHKCEYKGRASLLAARGARPRRLDQLCNAFDSVSRLDASEQRRAVVAHPVRVALHHLERGADVRRQVGLRNPENESSDSVRVTGETGNGESGPC